MINQLIIKPRKGQPLTYKGEHYGTVDHLDDRHPAICHFNHLDGHPDLFIWSFRDGLNDLFSWPGKDESLCCKYTRERRVNGHDRPTH